MEGCPQGGILLQRRDRSFVTLPSAQAIRSYAYRP